MPTSDILLVSPDGNTTITLKAATWGFTLKSGAKVEAVPEKDTIAIDEGFRTMVLTVVGKLTIASRVRLEELLNAALNWWSNGSGATLGQARLELGKKSDGSPFDFRVYIDSLAVDWVSEEPGGADSAGQRIMRYTLVFREVGVLGALN